jgi:hypothetical protein
MLAGIPLSAQETLELDNDTMHLKLDLTRGGAISYISKSGTTRNIVNIHDEGRYIQQSYYAGKVLDRTAEGQNPNWSPWPWNPIQVGDSYRNRAEILASSRYGNTLYVKCIPMLWDMNDEPAEAIMEQWTTLQGNVLKVRNRLTCQRTDEIWGEAVSRDQELPAVYPISALENLYSYFGPLPWTGAPLDNPEVVHLEGGFWGRYQGDRVTEHWMAFVDDSHWGIGVYTPICSNFLAGMAGAPGYEAQDGPTSYIAPVKKEVLDKHSVFEYTYWLVVGTLHQIRSRIYDIEGIQPIAWEFTDDLEGWHADPAGGTVRHSPGNLVFDVTGSGSGVSKHLSSWEAGALRYLWLGIKNATQADSGAISFYAATDSASIFYPITPEDTALRDVLVDLDTTAFWDSNLELEKITLHPVRGAHTGTVQVDFIRFLESTIRIRSAEDRLEIKGIGNSLQLFAEEVPSLQALAVNWSVDLPEVASISEAGLLTGVSEGVVTVYAAAKNGNIPAASARVVIIDTAQKTSWEFDTDLEGWDNNPHGGVVSWSDGSLKFTVTGTDPYVSNQVGPWKVGDLKYLWIRIRNETAGTGGAMYIFPSSGGHDFVRIPLTPNDHDFRDIVVDMRAAGIWDQDLLLDQLRLDPNNGGATGAVFVDFIRFLESPLGLPRVADGNVAGAEIYPNPSSDQLYIRDASDVQAAAIFDFTGRLLLRVSELPSRASVDIRSLPPGVYFLRCTNAKGENHAYKFIKK